MISFISSIDIVSGKHDLLISKNKYKNTPLGISNKNYTTLKNLSKPHISSYI